MKSRVFRSLVRSTHGSKSLSLCQRASLVVAACLGIAQLLFHAWRSNSVSVTALFLCGLRPLSQATSVCRHPRRGSHTWSLGATDGGFLAHPRALGVVKGDRHLVASDIAMLASSSAAAVRTESVLGFGFGKEKQRRTREPKQDTVKLQHQFRKLTTRVLRQRLEQLGLDTGSCLDRGCLIDLAVSDGVKAFLAARALAKTGKKSAAAKQSRKPRPTRSTPQTSTTRESDEGGIITLPIKYLAGTSQGSQYNPQEELFMSFDVAVGEKQELQTFVLDPSMRVAILNESAFEEAAGLTEPIPAAGDESALDGSSVARMRLKHMMLADGVTVDCEVEADSTSSRRVPDNVCGILGYDFMSECAWEFDFNNDVVRLAPLPPSKDGVPFDTKGMVEVHIEFAHQNPFLGSSMLPSCRLIAKEAAPHSESSLGRSAECIGCIDFLAPFSLCNAQLADEAEIHEDDLGNIGRKVTSVPGKTRIPVQEAQLDLSFCNDARDSPDAALPVLTLQGLTVGVCDAQFFRTLSKGEACVLVGLDIIGRSRAIYMPKYQALWLPCSQTSGADTSPE